MMTLDGDLRIYDELVADCNAADSLALRVGYKNILERLFNESEWYCVRWLAGSSLRRPLESLIPSWYSTLEKELGAMKDTVAYVTEVVRECPCVEDPGYHEKVFWGGGTNTTDAYYCHPETASREIRTTVPDLERRINAIMDLGAIHDRISDPRAQDILVKCALDPACDVSDLAFSELKHLPVWISRLTPYPMRRRLF